MQFDVSSLDGSAVSDVTARLSVLRINVFNRSANVSGIVSRWEYLKDVTRQAVIELEVTVLSGIHVAVAPTGVLTPGVPLERRPLNPNASLKSAATLCVTLVVRKAICKASRITSIAFGTLSE